MEKSGGDAFLWFLRKGGVSGEPDYIANIKGHNIPIEFQYASDLDLSFFDFKVSKIAPKKQGIRIPTDTMFLYIVKSDYKYGIFSAKKIFEEGSYGMVPAWRSPAYRVPKDKFIKLLSYDDKLLSVCKMINIKNKILDFQYESINKEKEKLSKDLQQVIDDDKKLSILPKDLNGLYKTCFILDCIDKTPKNANLWLIYLLTYIKSDNTLLSIYQITYCMDFLYSKIVLKTNEQPCFKNALLNIKKHISSYYDKRGFYYSDNTNSLINETRYALFSINLLEDMIQDYIYYYKDEELTPIKFIYESIEDIEFIYKYIIDIDHAIKKLR